MISPQVEEMMFPSEMAPVTARMLSGPFSCLWCSVLSNACIVKCFWEQRGNVKYVQPCSWWLLVSQQCSKLSAGTTVMRAVAHPVQWGPEWSGCGCHVLLPSQPCVEWPVLPWGCVSSPFLFFDANLASKFRSCHLSRWHLSALSLFELLCPSQSLYRAALFSLKGNTGFFIILALLFSSQCLHFRAHIYSY